MQFAWFVPEVPPAAAVRPHRHCLTAAESLAIELCAQPLRGLDAAIELASRIPAARMGGAVEVRRLVEQ